MLDEVLLNAGLLFFPTDVVLLNNLLAAKVLCTQLTFWWMYVPLINGPLASTDSPPEKQTIFSVQLMTFALMIN